MTLYTRAELDAMSEPHLRQVWRSFVGDYYAQPTYPGHHARTALLDARYERRHLVDAVLREQESAAAWERADTLGEWEYEE